MDALGALRPAIKGVASDRAEPRATGYIGPMVAMIEQLIARGHAYPKEGHVLFRVRSYQNYGALSGRSVDDMIAGARVEVAPFKEDPMDFVLWKPSSDQEPGWDSPWGRGRPGWHIECSAMSHELLGPSFDIHGGGLDLQFPHHENEIAQSACAHPEADFARYWMHNEMLQVEGKKMSKSLGNFFTVRDLLDQGVPGEVIRFVMLGTHYSKPMDWTQEKVDQAKETLVKWWAHSRSVKARPPTDQFLALISNDLNAAGAISLLRKMAADEHWPELRGCANLLGLMQEPEPEYSRAYTYDPQRKTIIASMSARGLIFNAEKLAPILNQIEAMRVELFDARKAQNWKQADQLREVFVKAGIKINIEGDLIRLHFTESFAPEKLRQPQ